jgi:hypothetical protein
MEPEEGIVAEGEVVPSSPRPEVSSSRETSPKRRGLKQKVPLAKRPRSAGTPLTPPLRRCIDEVM